MSREQDEWSITAELARLELNADEALILAREAERMRELFLTMSRAEVDHLEPTTHALSQGNRLRNDAASPYDNVDALIDASPEVEDRFFLIPNVL